MRRRIDVVQRGRDVKVDLDIKVSISDVEHFDGEMNMGKKQQAGHSPLLKGGVAAPI